MYRGKTRVLFASSALKMGIERASPPLPCVPQGQIQVLLQTKKSSYSPSHHSQLNRVKPERPGDRDGP